MCSAHRSSAPPRKPHTPQQARLHPSSGTRARASSAPAGGAQVCVETMMHLTCTNMPEEKLRDALDKLKGYGIQNVLALRGDPPKGQESFTVVEGGFACALDLVKYIRRAPGRGPRQGRGCPWGRPAPCCRCPSVAERTAAEGGAARVFTRLSIHARDSQSGCLPLRAIR